MKFVILTILHKISICSVWHIDDQSNIRCLGKDSSEVKELHNIAAIASEDLHKSLRRYPAIQCLLYVLHCKICQLRA